MERPYFGAESVLIMHGKDWDQPSFSTRGAHRTPTRGPELEPEPKDSHEETDVLRTSGWGATTSSTIERQAECTRRTGTTEQHHAWKSHGLMFAEPDEAEMRAKDGTAGVSCDCSATIRYKMA